MDGSVEQCGANPDVGGGLHASKASRHAEWWQQAALGSSISSSTGHGRRARNRGMGCSNFARWSAACLRQRRSTLRLWNVETRELIATLFNGTNGEWVM